MKCRVKSACCVFLLVCLSFTLRPTQTVLLSGSGDVTVTKSAGRRYQAGTNLTHSNLGRPGGPKTSCGVPEMCRCKGADAVCSRNYGRLAFIPKFPENIRFLNFSFNNLTAIPSDDFFLNITNIHILDLSNNRLKEISRGAFKVFKSLSVLLLICNYHLTYQSLGPVFGVRTLVSLDLRHGTLPAPPADLFRRYPLPRLHNNHLRITNMSVFTPLRNLRVLGLSVNGISFLTTDYFPQLQELNVGRNSLDSFPKYVHGKRVVPFPTSNQVDPFE